MIVPRKIFVFWHNEHLTTQFQNFLKGIKMRNSSFEVIMYTEKKFLDEFPEMEEKIKHVYNFQHGQIQKKSDLARLCLIKKYGGIYCDLATKCQKGFDEIFDMNYEGVQGFKVPSVLKMEYDELIEVGYICSPPNNELISEWLEKFIEGIEKGPDRFKEEFGKKYPKEKHFYNHWVKYLTAHACLYDILHTRDNVKLKVLPCLHLQLHQDQKWIPDKIRDFAKRGDISKYPIIKLRGCDRG